MKFDPMRAWNEGVAMLRANRDMLVPLAGVFILLPGLALLQFFPAPEMKPDSDFATIVGAMRVYFREYWWQILLAALVTSIGSLAVVALLTLRQRPTVSGAIAHGARALVPLVAAQMLFGAAIMLGGGTLVGLAAATGIKVLALAAVLAVCAFAAFIFIRIIVLSPVVVSTAGFNPVGALKRAMDLTRGNFWHLLAFFLLVTVAAMIATSMVGGLFGAVFRLALDGESARFADGLVTGILETGVSVLNIALICAAFRQLSGDAAMAAETFE